MVLCINDKPLYPFGAREEKIFFVLCEIAREASITPYYKINRNRARAEDWLVNLPSDFLIILLAIYIC